MIIIIVDHGDLLGERGLFCHWMTKGSRAYWSSLARAGDLKRVSPFFSKALSALSFTKQ